MSDPLTVYLQDHLGGSVQAVQLVEFLRDHHKDSALGAFATDLLNEIKADQEVLQGLAQRVGGGSSGLKELAAWFTEKVVRLKLKVENKDDLGTFESLEFLALGIQGKLALWRVLDEIAALEVRLRGIDLKRLAARAETQHALVEGRRLEIGRAVLSRGHSGQGETSE
jgi:hypothetical protein